MVKNGLLGFVEQSVQISAPLCKKAVLTFLQSKVQSSYAQI